MADQGASSRFPSEELNRIEADFHGRIGFYLEDLKTGIVHQCNADQRFPSASICKVPIMVELFRQAEEGRLALDDRRRLRGDISRSMGALRLLEDEPELSLRDCCRLMIYESDDMVTDFLLEQVGPASVNATLDELGFPDIRVCMPMGRWHYLMAGMGALSFTRENDELLLAKFQAGAIDFDSLPFQDARENNVTSPREMGILLKQLYRGQIVSPSASAAMLGMLERGRDRRMIPCHVRPGIAIAHKYGSSGRIRGDVGIVFLPTGPLIIAALALAREDGNEAVEAIARISRLAVEALAPECVEDLMEE